VRPVDACKGVEEELGPVTDSGEGVGGGRSHEERIGGLSSTVMIVAVNLNGV
jgi:hypothetical protein